MARVRANFFEGTLSSQLLSGATTVMSATLATFPEVASPDVAYLVIGNSSDTKEIVKVTAHSSSSTSATVVRGQEDTTNRTWPAGTRIIQAPLSADMLRGRPLGAVFFAEDFSTLQQAIDAANDAGGGVVQLPDGATNVSGTLQLKSKVILSGPQLAWSVWGYDADPSDYHTAWLEADGSSGSVIEVGTLVVGAGVRNLMIRGNGRRCIDVLDSTTRGGFSIKDVYAHGGDVYLGQMETRAHGLLVMESPGDGLTVAQQDCDLSTVLVGFSAGEGIVLGDDSGPARMHHIDTFNNGGDGIHIGGHGHTISALQSNSNDQRGVVFTTGTATKIFGLSCSNNSRKFLDDASRWPDVEFAHPSAGNSSCAIVGGTIDGTNDYGEYAIKNSEAVLSFPLIEGVSFTGTWDGSANPFDIIYVLAYFQFRGCTGVPDVTIPQGGAAPQFRAVASSTEIIQAQLTDGTEVFAVKREGDVALGISAPATSATEAFPYLPVMAGTPSGTPSGVTGFAPIVLDSVGTKLWGYLGSAWKSVPLGLSDSLDVKSGEMSIALGSPNEGSINRNAGWALANTEGIGTNVELPAHWATFDVDVWWSNASAASGNVSFRFDRLDISNGDTLNTPTTGTIVTTAAPAQGVVKVTTIASGLTVPAAGDRMSFVLLRSSTSDTLGANDVVVMAVRFRNP